MKIPVVFALVGILCGASLAQPTPQAPTAPNPADKQTRTFQIRLKNVKPSVVAWWLDPEFRDKPKAAPARPAGIVQGLPAGVERIVAVDPQNALLVFGTEVGVANLQRTIQALDKTTQNVEFSLYFFQVDSDSLGKLGIRPTQNTGVTVGHIPQELSAVLPPLIKSGKAVSLSGPWKKVATAQQLTEFKFDSERGVTWGVESPKGWAPSLANQEGFNKLTNGTPLRTVNRWQYQVTPTLNQNNSIAIKLSGEQQLFLKGKSPTEGTITLGHHQLPELTATMHDGETIAFEETYLPKRLDIPKSKIVVLLTARLAKQEQFN